MTPDPYREPARWHVLGHGGGVDYDDAFDSWGEAEDRRSELDALTDGDFRIEFR